MSLKVIGHKAPDTDSTCSPIVYAWFLSEYRGVDATAYLAGKPNREAQFVLEYFEVDTPEVLELFREGDRVVLVDTHNPEELPDGLEEAQVVEVVDHHKMFGLKTDEPIDVTIRTYGSVPTVMWDLISEIEDDMPNWVAGLLLAPILSDTLNFTSVTTTEQDKELAEKLAEIADIDMDDFVNKMFAAKSNLEGMDAKEILLSDSKVFEFGDKKVRVSVLETTDYSQPLKMRTELIEGMNEVKTEEELDMMFFFAIDILESNAYLLSSTPEEDAIASEAFDGNFVEDVMKLEGVVSRKKQIAPKLAEILD